MRKFYTTCCFILIIFVSSAQSNEDSTYSFQFSSNQPPKAVIHLKDNSTITGAITKITDSTIELSVPMQNVNGFEFRNAAITQIKSIKIKRHAFFLGMGCGAVVTGFIGYAVGYVSYTDDPGLDDTENKYKAQLKGYEGAGIGLVPGAVIGSLVGSVVIKRKFTINGDINNIKAMIKTLSK